MATTMGGKSASRLVHALGLLLLMLAMRAAPAYASPENGWWWNPAESGRGFFIEIAGNLAFIGAYVYAADGRADWVVSQGTMRTPSSYSGRLLSFRNGQTLTGAYRAPGAPADVGAIAIDFHDDRHATLTWPGGSVAIERFIFDSSGERPFPKTGWWWNDQENGTGYSIEVQGSTLFFVAFMYDDVGNPVWYSSVGPMTDAYSYGGALIAFANGQAIGSPYRVPGPPSTVGRLQIEFTAPDTGTLTLADTSAADFHAKANRSAPIRRTLPPQDIPDPPHAYRGTFTEVRHLVGNDLDSTYDYTWTVTSRFLWSRNGPGPDGEIYELVASFHMTLSGRTVDVDGTICTAAADMNGGLPVGLFDMVVRGQGSIFSYSFSYDMPVFEATTCVSTDGEVRTTTRQTSFPFFYTRRGFVIDGRIAGWDSQTFEGPDFIQVKKIEWQFDAVP